MSKYWNVCPSLRNMLFAPSQRNGYSVLKVEPSKIKSVIFENPEFLSYSDNANKRFDGWRATVLPMLRDIKVGAKPKELIHEMSERLLSAFSNDELIDKYDVYQQLMEYWSETMQDDVYLIITVEGWRVGATELKNKNGKVTGWSHDLIPKEIVVNKYFTKEQEDVDALKVEAEKISQQMQAIDEENSGEDDLFADARNSSGKITKKELTKQIREIRSRWEFGEELKALEQYLGLMEQESKISGNIRDLEKTLDKKLLIKYKSLSEGEIKALVVEHKWMTTIRDSIKNEIERVTQKLAGRIKELVERYEDPLPNLINEVSGRSKRVDDNLKSMGFSW